MAKIGAYGPPRSAAPQPRRLPAAPSWVPLVVLTFGALAVFVGAEADAYFVIGLGVGALVTGGHILGRREGEARPDPEARARALRYERLADYYALLLADDGGVRAPEPAAPIADAGPRLQTDRTPNRPGRAPLASVPRADPTEFDADLGAALPGEHEDDAV